MDAKIKSAKSPWVGPRISLETGRVDKIPYLALIPEHTEPCPVVFSVLVMNGDFDSDQPKHYVLEWLREVRETYAGCPDRLQWKVYPVGHVITPEMEQDTVEWFVQHLADD